MLHSTESLEHIETQKVKTPVKFTMKLKEAFDDDETARDKEETHKTPLLRSDSSKSRGQTHNHPHYLQNIKFRKNSIGYRGAMLNLHSKYKVTTSSCPDFFKNAIVDDDDEDEEVWLLQHTLICYINLCDEIKNRNGTTIM